MGDPRQEMDDPRPELGPRHKSGREDDQARRPDGEPNREAF